MVKNLLKIIGVTLSVAGVYFLFFSSDKQFLGLVLFLGVYIFLNGIAHGKKLPVKKELKTGWVHVPGVGDIRVNLSS